MSIYAHVLLCKIQLSGVLELLVNPDRGILLLPSPATESLFSGHRKKGKTAQSRWREMDDVMSRIESDICVTDSPSSSPQERRFIKDNDRVEICLYDQWGNVAEFPPSREHICVCQVKHNRENDYETHPNYLPTQQDTNYSDLRLPILEGARAQGYLLGKRVSDCYQFSSLALKEFAATEGRRGADGQLKLVFSLIPVEFLDDSDERDTSRCFERMRLKLEIKPFLVVFNFTSDEARVQASHLLNEQLQVWNMERCVFFNSYLLGKFFYVMFLY